MKKNILILSLLFLAVTIAPYLIAQEEVVDRLSVPFSNPAEPGFLEVGLVNGGITVTGYDGTEVIVEAKARMKSIKESKQDEKVKGMIRIPVTTTGLEIEEENNHIEIGVESYKRTIDLDIKVPVKTSLNLTAVNHGDIYVENVEGELEIENVNGRVTLKNVTGSVMAHALNKDLIVNLVRVYPDKDMSFSTLNGDIDVTFPSTIKADLKLKSDNGNIYSDFEIQLQKKSKKIVEGNEDDKDGRYRVKIESAVYGSINGGGPEIQFTSFNGDIMIRKAK